MGYIPYCYLGAAIVVIYKLVALVFTSFYQIKIEKRKDYLDGDSFLQTAFGEWFSGKKENIAKNYSVLPKDSLVSKDGVEVDLINLRKLISKKEDYKDGPR